MAGVKLAVFDCDGTLVDGQAEVCAAMAHAFQEAGLPAPSSHDVRRIVGLSLPQAVARLAPAASAEATARAVDAYKGAFRLAREEGRLQEPLYDGIAPMLRRLHADGWLLGVATGKSDRGLAACLATHGLADLFVTLQTADRHPSKPHPAMLEAALAQVGAQPEDAAMIGDTVFDMAMAEAAGVRALGVSWGYHERAELIAAGAAAVVDSPAELEGLL
ncbi:HAD-IA family hydrolase [Croceibacterium sp. TMG7-5b_MA50]|uniref:HAD-IA family hydrolase n=1 Tax=Croceibacterium sp. TMG7-5b_MA50 TaxID=3121290 RepID=UPI003221CE11